MRCNLRPAVAKFYWDQLADPCRVLDLGCGDGFLGRYKPAGVLIQGLEILPDMVKKAAQFEMVQIWDLDSSEKFPFADGYFDAVVAKDILEHLQRPWKVLEECKRVLRPGGIIMASVICYRSRRLWSDYTHVRGFTMESARNMLHHAGFHVLDVWRMGPVPLSARLNFIRFIPCLLRFAFFDRLWTSSYEIKASRPL